MPDTTGTGCLEISQFEAAIGAAIFLHKIGAGPPPIIGGRFEVEALLGTGGFGSVVRARDLQLERRVAVKLVPTNDPTQGHESIASEAQALASLDVSEVVTLFDALATSVRTGSANLPCVAIIMALVDGRNLRVWMGRAHSHEERVAILLSASKGLEAAHAVGLVHRDFKPENVMVTPDSQARVVDFGLAYRVSRAGAGAQLVARGSVGLGTPEYMAPEALEGTVSPASDQYSFAVTAWELLAGARPFERPGQTSSRTALARADRIERGIARVLARGLAKAPDRFPRLADLRGELEQCLAPRWRPGLAVVSVGAAVLGAAAGAWVVNKKRET
jgi:serine/threonine protein kinase